MPKTTNGDGMERRAEKFFAAENQEFKELYVPPLTRLLRKVAKESKKSMVPPACFHDDGTPRTEWTDGWNACMMAVLHRLNGKRYDV